MKLFYSPGACSIGIHLLLEEIGKPYSLARIDLRSGAQFEPDYVHLNPKSKVPALLRDDGTLLTEFPAIAVWLAKSNPEKNLIAPDLEGEVRTLELIDYVVSSLHMQGFSRIFKPEKFAPSESDLETVRTTGREIITAGLKNISNELGSKDFFIGDRLTIADCALFYLLFWVSDRVKMAVPANLEAYYQRLKSRPTARKVFADEDISLD